MRLVIVESPFAGDVAGHTAYARAAIRDCLQRGESPLASHLLFTQDGVLDDGIAAERQLGIEAGLDWYRAAEAAVFYMDKGYSGGMKGAHRYLAAHHPDLPVEWRFTAPAITATERLALAYWFRWEPAFLATTADQWAAEMPLGRLEVDRLGKSAPTKAAPFEVRFKARPVAFYASRAAAIAGAEHFYRWVAARPGGDVSQ